jgi:predicted metal-binding membrane protein
MSSLDEVSAKPDVVSPPPPLWSGTRREVAASAVLLAIAALAWWWTLRQDDMTMSLLSFLVAWVVMMVAMMLPAVAPVVRLYARAVERGRAAPTPVFLAGYLVVWSAIGVPSYLAWRWFDDPLMMGEPWAGRLAGAVLVAAALYQLSPVKDLCLQHCRSPMSLFLQAKGSLARPLTALSTGARHGLYCLGCCWMLMACLVAVGTMNPLAMVAVAAVIFLEKNLRQGELVARLAAVALFALGVWLLAAPSNVMHLT